MADQEDSLTRNRDVRPDPAVRPTIPAEESFPLLGISRNTGYELIRRGEFPVPVLRLGRKLRIPTAPLLDLLAGRTSPPPSAAA
jgi:predicted DNA-binding transcriptional regulator AlpA